MMYAMLALLVKETSFVASLLFIFPSLYSFKIYFAEFGYPSKKPIITVEELFWDTLNILEITLEIP